MIRLCAGNPEQWLAQHRGKQPVFTCVLSFTETGLIPNISAAGISPQDRQYTALADAELLFSGAAARYPLPPLAAGISPAVITRAILARQAIPLHLLSTGLPDRLTVPHIKLPTVVAKPVQTGQAMTLEQAAQLLHSGLQWGQRLSHSDQYLIMGECVVGGTTTAQAVLSALGYAVTGRIGSSHRHANHSQKQALVSQGLAAWRRRGNSSSLTAAAAVGDPMQLVVAGMLLAASNKGGVLLAGGAQMLAVYALARAIAQQQQIAWQPDQVVVGTTRWVIEDRSADTIAIARAIGAPYLASQIDFSQSPYFQLRTYERGFVKEGLGAGGCAIAAHLYRGWTQTQLRHAVEAELRLCL